MAGPNNAPPTVPANEYADHTAPLAILAPKVELPDQAVLAHRDYVEVQKPWAIEEHVGPVRESIALGDVEAFAAYVHRFGPSDQLDRVLLTWSTRGLRAVLDYHQGLDAPGRAQWVAEHPFTKSEQWKAWTSLANGETVWSQKDAVNKLDQLAEDIVEPSAATVIDIIRKLRASVTLTADSEMREDGGQLASFTKDSKVTTKVPIPAELKISIPVLQGHTNENGVPVLYGLPVKVRPSVDDTTGKMTFRFFMPTAERVLETVYADRVAAAKALLGEAYPLLRAAS